VVQPLTTRPSPEDAVREYFALVMQRRYDLTWNMLTDGFKAKNNPDGKEGYVKWGDSFSDIQINRSDVVTETEDFARLNLDITFYRYSQQPYNDGDFQIELIWDSTTGQWMIDATP
jgi:serine/threonine-protein kinase